jgi:hypothetical protein
MIKVIISVQLAFVAVMSSMISVFHTHQLSRGADLGRIILAYHIVAVNLSYFGLTLLAVSSNLSGWRLPVAAVSFVTGDFALCLMFYRLRLIWRLKA